MKRKLGLAAFVVTFAMCTSAWATLILPGTEIPLQTVLNNITVLNNTVGGPSSVNVNSDQAGYDNRWMVTGSGNASATMIIEIAGYANTNTFGVYNGSTLIPLFVGPAHAGDRATFSLFSTGSARVIRPVYDAGGVYTGEQISIYANFVSSNNFGFYLTTPDATWYSEDSRNTDLSDHMVAFAGKNDTVELPGAWPGPWTPNEYVLAWEDLQIGQNGSSDKDYNDMVLMVESVKPVPEPGTMLLLGSGLVGLAGWGRKKFRK